MALVGTQHCKLENLPQILQLDAGGNPQRWIDYEDSMYYYSKNLVAWSMGEMNVTLFGGNNAVTGKQSTLTVNTIIAVKGKSASAKQMAAAMRVPLSNKALFRRDQFLCAYCGHEFHHRDLTRDHIVPVSKNGPNIWTNVVTACESCNKEKDDRTPEEAGMQLLYVPYAPSRAEYLILQNRRILFDQMEFLLSRVNKDSRLLKEEDKRTLHSKISGVSYQQD